MEAPHQWPGLLVFPTKSYVTCQGQSPGAAISPPTIRVWPLPLTPHVGGLEVGGEVGAGGAGGGGGGGGGTP